MDIQSICRTCLGLGGPFLSIFVGDGDTNGTLSDKLRDFTKIKAKCGDKMPEKVCLTCIGEINRCYTFILKCDNSNRTLRQLIPDALPEVLDDLPKKVPSEDKAIQTAPVQCLEIGVQTQPVQEEHDIDIPVAPKQKSVAKVPIQHNLRARKRKVVVPVNSDSPPIDKKPRLLSTNINVVELDDGSQVILELDDETTSAKVEMTNHDDEKAVHYELSEYSVSEGEAEQDLQFYEVVENESEEDHTTNKDEHVGKAKAPTPKVVETDLKCSSCTMTFANAHNLQRHRTKFHGKAKKACELMHEADEAQTEENQQLESSEDDLGSTVGDTTETDSQTGEHLESQTLVSAKVTIDPVVDESEPGNGPLFRCDLCNAGFVKQTSLKHHRKLKACMVESHKCNKCERIFISEEAMLDHKKTYCADLSCSMCAETFQKAADFTQHMIKEHNRNIRHQCKECNKVFTMMSALKDHMRIHTGEKPFVCPFCNKAFSQSANLRQHVSRHSEVKKFKCNECSFSCVTKAELQSHLRSHSSERQFKCDQCPAAYTTSSSLCKHRRIHTGERPYACEYCPMRFTTLNILKNHRRTHTGEKPYKCKHCTKAFAQRGDCLIHERIHTGEKNYVCGDCGSSFARLTLARTHLKASASCKEILRKSDDKETIQHYTITGIEEMIVNESECF